MRRIKNIHFIGIGGAGMGGIAEVLHNKHYKISGSDQVENTMVKHLSGLGIKISIGHSSENIKGADVVVISSAISQDNPEWQAAKLNGIPVVRRAEMLAELMRFGESIAIAGTHGKTTTTSILATIMATAKLDPTFVIGGKLNSIGANARLGEGKYFIAEADESDASFLHLNPVISIVTNIDRDHMPTYGGDFQNLRKVFIDFLLRLPFYGLAIINIDDPVARDIIPQVRCQVLTFGKSANADYQLLDYKQVECMSYFKVLQKSTSNIYSFNLNLPGIHNAMNALSAIAVCMEEGLNIDAIKQGLIEFKGIDRRFQTYKNLKLKGKTFTLIDDYGHHPQEILSTIDAIYNGWPDKRVVMLYQPHRYTRTRDLFDDFVKVLSKVKVLALAPVYPASELPIAGATSKELYQAIRNSSDFINNNNKCYLFDSVVDTLENLDSIIDDGDIVVVQGAGDISSITTKLISQNSGYRVA